MVYKSERQSDNFSFMYLIITRKIPREMMRNFPNQNQDTFLEISASVFRKESFHNAIGPGFIFNYIMVILMNLWQY